jgi:hypothetical protein
MGARRRASKMMRVWSGGTIFCAGSATSDSGPGPATRRTCCCRSDQCE